MTTARGMLWLVCAAVAWWCLAGRASGTVSCHTACAQCAARTEHQALLEVYCAMCHECRERRRAWKHFAPRRRKAAPGPSPSHRANSADEFPDESRDEPPVGHPEEWRCPEPPPCDSELPDGGPDLLMPSTPERQASTPLPTPPAALPAPGQPCHEHGACPPAVGAPCCVPLCPYAHPYGQPCAQGPAPQMLTWPESTTSPAPTEYFYIHVGVPKDVLSSM